MLLVPLPDPVSEGPNGVFGDPQRGPLLGLVLDPSNTGILNACSESPLRIQYLPIARILGTGTYPSYDPQEVLWGPSQGHGLGPLRSMV